MTGSSIVFGAFIPQGWKMELASIDGAEAKWARAVEIAQLAEQLGIPSCPHGEPRGSRYCALCRNAGSDPEGRKTA